MNGVSASYGRRVVVSHFETRRAASFGQFRQAARLLALNA
jgi:hypothetical protein